MKIIKLTFNYQDPIFRQTPNNSKIWGDYKFVISDELKDYDYWVVYGDYKLQAEKILCPKENLIFIPGECRSVSPFFYQHFLDQFGMIITVQRELKHKNIQYSHNANPWFVGKSYDELMSHKIPVKSKLISVITSDKQFTEGHKKRYEFVMKLKEYFGNQLDLFGRGVNSFDDKWDTLADYKYSIAIENDSCEDWVTEKLFDCFYANTLPFYYGCPNIEDYIDSKTIIKIDINDIKRSISVIEKTIQNNEYEKRFKLLQKQKIKSLNEDQFFPWIISFIEKINQKGLKRSNMKLRMNKKMNFKTRIFNLIKYT